MNFNLLDFFRSTNYEIKNFPEFRERFRFRSMETLRLDNFQIFQIRREDWEEILSEQHMQKMPLTKLARRYHSQRRPKEQGRVCKRLNCSFIFVIWNHETTSHHRLQIQNFNNLVKSRHLSIFSKLRHWRISFRI